jgi:predicted ATPase/class 3 adenylate cyclase
VSTGEGLPSGTVAFVFTDIEGSTRLLRRLGDGYAAVLERHRALLRAAWTAHRGHEVDSTGDSCFVAFWSVADAVAACADAQRGLRQERWPAEVRVLVRMGIHAGLASPLGSRYVAIAVHQAARIAEVAHGGQVVLSRAAVDELGPDGVRVQPLGSFRVRDFDQPVALYELVSSGRAYRFPAVRALPADGHNLVTPVTGLIEREAELTELLGLVARHRLVSIVGTGGIGKTRLATELGIRAAGSVPDGVWLVDCSLLEEPSMLPASVTAALGIAGTGEPVVAGDVLAALRSRRTVLVLDSCERHVDAVAGLVASVLSACPDVRVLCTSRQPLHLPGEVLLRLRPLSTDEGAASGAVRLFVERARAVRPGFRLAGDAETAVVVALCRRLDGLPLALEIAAARMTVLQPAEILAGLVRQSRVLRSPDHTRPARHRALETLLDWSVRLLPEAERTALRRLALLAAGFDADTAAVAVAAADLAAELVPELVWSLVDKSLLVADPGGGGTRYRALETVRAYAAELLEAHGESAACAARLAAYYADRYGPARGTGRHWVHAVAAELDNLRSVVWAVAAAGGGATAASAAQRRAHEHAQQVACAIAAHHDAVQSLHTGIDEVARLSAALPGRTCARVGLLTALGLLRVRTGDLTAAEADARAAEALRAAVGPPEWDEVGVERLLGEIEIQRRQPRRAAAIAETALRGDLSARGRARMYNQLGIALAAEGADRPAVAAFQGELAAAYELDDEVLLVHAHGNLAEMALRLGDRAAAVRHQRACLDLAAALGQTGMVAYSLLATARLAAGDEPAPEDLDAAVRLTATAERMLADSGLALYDTDQRLVEELLVTARGRLGAARYATQQQVGRATPTAGAVAAAEQVLLRCVREPAGSRR